MRVALTEIDSIRTYTALIISLLYAKNVCGGIGTLVPNVIAVDNLYNPVRECIMKNEEIGRSVTQPHT